VELMEVDAPGESLPAERRKAAAAWRGGAGTAVAASGMVGAFYLLASATFPLLVRSLAANAPQLVPLVLPALALLAPALMCLPVAGVAAALARREARVDPDHGMAAAAGAGIGASVVAGAALGWVAAALGSLAGLVLLLPYGLSAAFGVGIVGAAAFREARRAAPGGASTPPLYQLLTAASVGGFALLATAPLWTVASWIFPGLSAAHLFATFGITATAAAMLTSLAPVTFGVARMLESRFDRPHRRALGYGLAVPALMPAVVYGWLALFYQGPASAPLAATFLGFSLGALPHALTIFAGLGPHRGRRALEGPREPVASLPEE